MFHEFEPEIGVERDKTAEFSALEANNKVEFRRCYTGACSFTACDIQFIFKRPLKGNLC